MDVEKSIKAITSKTFFLVALDVVFLVLPGISLIYLNYPDLFEKLDVSKLILLASSITGPMAILNTLSLNNQEKNKKSSDKNIFFNFTTGIMLAGLSLYIVTVMAYLLSVLAPRLIGVPQIILFSIVINFSILAIENYSASKEKKKGNIK